MFGKHSFAAERQMLAIWTGPFSPVILKFMGEPFVAAAKHSELAFFEGTFVWFQVTKDVFPIYL
jgi:hypothetical protein